jgi:uncharacterized protein YcbX
MITLREIWRYPIKSHSREQLAEISVTAGQSLPRDRIFAVAHDASDADGSTWAPCTNFSIGAKAPMLTAVNSDWSDDGDSVTLTHPNRDPITLRPDHDSDALIAWTKGMIPENRAHSARLISARARGMTDTDYPSISIGNLASHRDLEQRMGMSLSHLRWRTNLWVDGAAPWAEFDWIGQSIRVGDVIFDIKEPVKRCLATTANPATGERDADTLSALNAMGHQNFTVYAVARSSGNIRENDPVEVIT